MKKECTNCGGLGCPSCHGGAVKATWAVGQSLPYPRGYWRSQDLASRARLDAFLAGRPRVLPTRPQPRPAVSHRRAETAFLLALSLLLVVLAALKH